MGFVWAKLELAGDLHTMSTQRKPSKPEPTAVGLDDFADPFEFIYGEHERIRRCWEQLEHLAADPTTEGAPEVARSILNFIEKALPLHIADEEEDLFPLLKRRSPSNDDIVAMLTLLTNEHRDDIEHGRSLIRTLRSIEGGVAPADLRMFADYVRAFVMLQRRHQAMENNVVMAAAFDRLTPQDIEELGRKMALRRGLSIPG